jgi:hypothetical protein
MLAIRVSIEIMGRNGINDQLSESGEKIDQIEGRTLVWRQEWQLSL